MSDIVERLQKSHPTNCTSGICPLLKDEAAAEIARLRERVRVLELFQTEAIAARSILGLKGSLGFAHKFEADSIWAGYRNARNAATDAAKAMEDA